MPNTPVFGVATADVVESGEEFPARDRAQLAHRLRVGISYISEHKNRTEINSRWLRQEPADRLQDKPTRDSGVATVCDVTREALARLDRVQAIVEEEKIVLFALRFFPASLDVGLDRVKDVVAPSSENLLLW